MLNEVKVIFENPIYNYSTDVSALSTEESATAYFVGREFNVGVYPVENMQKCIAIEFINNN